MEQLAAIKQVVTSLGIAHAARSVDHRCRLAGTERPQIAETARRHRPRPNILFVTDYAEHATAHAPFLEPGMEMVTKPFALDALALKIREMITSSVERAFA